jgi:hypothetical protein
VTALIACLTLACPLQGRDQSSQTTLEGLGLETMTVGRVTALFPRDDRARARQLAELSEAAAAFFEKELNRTASPGVQWPSD